MTELFNLGEKDGLDILLDSFDLAMNHEGILLSATRLLLDVALLS